MLTFASFMLFLGLALWFTSLLGKRRASRGTNRPSASSAPARAPKGVWVGFAAHVLLCAALISLIAFLWMS